MNNKKTVYHGTAWEIPLMPDDQFVEASMIFNDLSSNKNELNAFFVSDKEAVCEMFAGEKGSVDSDMFLQVILKVELEASDIVEKDFSLGRDIEHNGKLFDYSNNDDRISLYEELRTEGKQAFIMNGDYALSSGEVGQDIAVLDDQCVKAIAVKFKLGNTWTEYMNYEEAKERFKEWSQDPMSYIDENHENNQGYDNYESGFSY